ncbi:MAG: hypothetical protein ABIM40_01680 [Pseudomonadota bacterium]
MEEADPEAARAIPALLDEGKWRAVGRGPAFREKFLTRVQEDLNG